MQGNESDLHAPRAGAGASEDVQLHQVNERLDVVARSLQELRVRREVFPQPGADARSREATRSSIEVANAKLAEIQAELDGLRVAMRNRALIEQAKGMLMVRLRIDEDKAFDYLRTLSNASNRKLSEVAADVVRTRAGESEFG